MSNPLIRRADQVVLAALVAVALAGATLWWARAGGFTGGLVEIDNAPPRDYRFLVDVNAAKWPELAQLPGVGPTIAQRIVESRQAEGDYRTLDELRRVNGLGPRKLEGMRRYLLPLPEDQQVAGDDWDAEERGSSG